MAQYLEDNAAIGVDCPQLSVGKLALTYLDHCRKRGEETTEVNCVRIALRPLCQLFSNTLARDFTPRKLKAVLSCLPSNRSFRVLELAQP